MTLANVAVLAVLYKVFYGGFMTIVDMLSQSGVLTLLGLGVVFSFIVIMIGAMHLLHWVLHKLHLDEDAPAQAANGGVKSAPPKAAVRDDKAVVAAIAAAIRQ